MRSLGVIKDQVVCQFPVEEGLVPQELQVVVDELLLDRAVIALDVGVDLGAVGVGKPLGDIFPLQLLLELPPVLRPVIRLPRADRIRTDPQEALVEVLHVPAGQLFVTEREGKFRPGIQRAVEIVLHPVRHPLHRVRNAHIPQAGGNASS